MLSKNLVKKSGLYFIGNISTKLLSFILLPVYAYYVTTNDFGNYDLMNTFANLVAPIIFISIWDGVLKSLLDNNTSDKNSILSTAYILAFIVFTLITLIMMLYFMICGIDNFILGVYIITISFSFLSLWQYSARGLKANNAYVIASACSAIINFIFSIFMLVVLKLGIKSLLLATAIGSFTGIVIIEFRVKILKRITKNKFNKDILYQMTKYSVPLVVNAIAGWGILSVCRIIISYKLGTEMNGIYSYATKFNQLIMIFGQIFNMAWLEESIMSIRTKGARDRKSVV
jgi:O-antigen/teichoic acid export membrane protein